MPLTQDDPAVESPRTSPTQYKSLIKYFAVRLCVAVTLGVILLIAFEFYSYLRYRKTGRDALEPAVKLDLAENGNNAMRQYWKEFDESNKVTYHQYVLWRRSPFNGEAISINEDGIRRTLNTGCEGNTFTIWMFGDSVMWGAGSPDGETIPSLVAREYQNAGKPVCVVNYGEKGWSNTQEMIGLIEQLKHAARKPNLVLFYDGGTEAFSAYQSGRADVHSNFDMFKNFLESWGISQKANFAYLEQTNTYRFLEKIAVKAPFHQKPEDAAATKPDIAALSTAVVDNYVQNMDIVNLLAKQYGFRPVFAFYPNLAVGHKAMTPYERQVLSLQYQEFPDLGLMYRAVYEKSSLIRRNDFYNLEGVVDEQKSSLYVGLSHMKPEGNEIVAHELFDIFEHDNQASSARPPGLPAASGK